MQELSKSKQELLPIPAFAENDEDAEDAIESLGWAAIGAGVIANMPFILFNKWRKYAVRAGGQSLLMARKAVQFYKPVLNFHIILNSVGYFAGMTHGLFLVSDLDSISLSLAITMPVLNIVGTNDDLVSAESSRTITDVISSKDKKTLEFPTGHVGLCISRTAHKKLWPEVGNWLKEHSV